MRFGRSRDARLVPAGGGEEPLVARSVRASSLLSPRFIRGLGMRELLSGGELLICSDRILTCRIKSICSPAKGGTGCYRFNYQPGS